jgi:lipoprotein-releasing system permease protein
LLSLAIVRGFSQEITEKIFGFGAHVQVQSYVNDQPLTGAGSLRGTLQSTDGVSSVSSVVEDVVLLRQSDRSIDGIQLLGVDAAPDYIARSIVDGASHIRTGGEAPSLIVGAGLADRLGLSVGDRVTAFSLQEGKEGGDLRVGRPRVDQFRIGGIYETSLSNVDDNFAFTNLSTARRLVGFSSNAVTRFDVTVNDIGQVDSVATRIEETLGFPASARTIYQLQPYASLFAWVDLQQSIIPLVIGVIVIVAAFNIVGILLMIILEKTREIGVLQSLGTSQTMVKRLFLAFGLLIGTVGTVIGSAIALALGFLQQRFAIIPLPEEAYYMTTAPIELNPIDYLIVSTLTLALCGLAAYIPARVAARIEPVRAIRFQ